jgi:hypothetical protein
MVLSRRGDNAVKLRAFACAVVAAFLMAAPSAAQQTNSIEDLFSEFEAICFSYGEHGYSLETNYLIEAAGFKFMERARNGADIYNSRLIQLVIDDEDCAFGMVQLPFAQMLEWTKQWIAEKGLAYAHTAKSPSGGEYWIWGGKAFFVGLQDNKFPDGTPMTGLILTRRKEERGQAQVAQPN